MVSFGYICFEYVCFWRRVVWLFTRGGGYVGAARLCLSVCWVAPTHISRSHTASFVNFCGFYVARVLLRYPVYFANCWMNIYWLNHNSNLVCFTLCSENYTTPFLCFFFRRKKKKTTFPLRNKHVICGMFVDFEVRQCFTWNRFFFFSPKKTIKSLYFYYGNRLLVLSEGNKRSLHSICWAYSYVWHLI